MDLLLQIASYAGRTVPGPVLIMMLGYLIKKVSTLGSNHLEHVSEALARIETLLRSMNDNVIYIKARVEHESEGN